MVQRPLKQCACKIGQCRPALHSRANEFLCFNRITAVIHVRFVQKLEYDFAGSATAGHTGLGGEWLQKENVEVGWRIVGAMRNKVDWVPRGILRLAQNRHTSDFTMVQPVPLNSSSRTQTVA